MKTKSNKSTDKNIAFDLAFSESEQLPKKFTINFGSFLENGVWKTRVTLDGMQVGDVITDNSRVADAYRFHDIFHFSFATMLGWSPCTRSMLNRKRKSDPAIDDHEDGARATITEEAISLLLFFEAKNNNFFEGANTVSATVLHYIKGMTADFEVDVRTAAEWEKTILISYDMFRKLKDNGGGTVEFDAFSKDISYRNSLQSLASNLQN
jgi:hypothetical protein